MVDWGLPEHALPGYIRSHIHRSNIDTAKGEYVLVPTFRLPTLIHTRSANAKWLYEISNSNPVWIHTSDAARIGVASGDLVRVTTRIGFFVNRAWVTEGIRPGVVACSHHIGRWRRVEGSAGLAPGKSDEDGNRWMAAPARIEEQSPGKWRILPEGEVGPFESSDPDSSRVFWSDSGVHQNITFPVQPDPISGMHCWHQKVFVTKAAAGDVYGEVVVDTTKSHEAYKEWLALTRPGPGPGGLRRPRWMARPLMPDASVWTVTD
jgi:anaerobic selenocysteine-containing dehydrogenase